MIVTILLSLIGSLIPAWIGVAVLLLLYPGRTADQAMPETIVVPGRRPSPGLLLCFGALGGFGLVSLIWFAALWSRFPLPRVIPIEIGISVLLLILVVRPWGHRGRQPSGNASPSGNSGSVAAPGPVETMPPPPRESSRLSLLVKWAMPAALFIAVVTFGVRSILHSHGGFDVWAIWNLHARFLYRAPETWSAFMINDLAWSHPDYPLLWPILSARSWTFAGHETTLAPALVSFAFLMAVLGIVYFALAETGGDATRARLAVIVLIGTPFLVIHAADKYADVPLAAFLLAAIVLLVRHARSGSRLDLILGGFMIGLAAWTKNEGAMIVLAVVAAVAAAPVAARPAPKQRAGRLLRALAGTGWIVAGAALPIAALLVFKFGCPIPNDLVGAQTGQTLVRRATDPARYLQIAKAFLVEAQLFGRSPVSYYGLAAWFFLSGRNAARPEVRRSAAPGEGAERSGADSSPTTTAFISVLFILAGYFMVYVVTPRDLSWHLDHSLNRLLLQIWPASVFLVFAAAGKSE